jgi:hypothetical protein
LTSEIELAVLQIIDKNENMYGVIVGGDVYFFPVSSK